MIMFPGQKNPQCWSGSGVTGETGREPSWGVTISRLPMEGESRNLSTGREKEGKV